MFLRIIKHLLPKSPVWQLSHGSAISNFFQALANVFEDVKIYLDLVYEDLYPETTRQLPAWEEQFALPENTLLTEAERRTRLAAAWQAVGGQSPRYIQDLLQANGFDVYVHEWWETPLSSPPAVRDPRIYLRGSQRAQFLCSAGAAQAVAGAAQAVAGASITPRGYPLVNKIEVRLIGVRGAGNPNMVAGAAQAVAGGGNGGSVFKQIEYDIPVDPLTWPYFVYIGGPSFPDLAQVPQSRRNEFEALLLKIKPSQLWLGMLIDYT